MRLAQIVGNFSTYRDPYHYEDDDFAQALEEAMYRDTGMPVKEHAAPNDDLPPERPETPGASTEETNDD
jgi:hypothetical protein